MGKEVVPQEELAQVRADIAILRDKLGEVEAETRVTKHAVANVQQSQVAINGRLDKFEEKIGGKLDLLSEKISCINTQQQRGFGFAAGVAFVVTACGTILLTVIKFLFHG